MTYRCPYIKRALENLDGYPSNERVVAKAIELNLLDSKRTGKTAVQAEQAIKEMMAAEFVNTAIVSPFVLECYEHSFAWKIRVQYPLGEPFLINRHASGH